VEGPASLSSAREPRILSIGEVFSLDGGGTHVASCEALSDAVVICVDGTSVERLTARDEAAARRQARRAPDGAGATGFVAMPEAQGDASGRV